MPRCIGETRTTTGKSAVSFLPVPRNGLTAIKLENSYAIKR